MVGTVNSVVAFSSAYQCKFIVFAPQLADKFDVPEYVSNVESLQVALFEFDAIFGSANDTEVKTNNVDKKLSNKLHVCVCVCVCV